MKKFMLVFAILIAATAAHASYQNALKLFSKGDYEESLKLIADELVIENDLAPDSPNYNLRFLAAHNHWKLGNYKSAAAHFTRCIAIRSQNADPFIDLALLQLDNKRYNEAEQTARRGLSVKKSALLYYVLGKIYLERKSYWNAKAFLERANAIDPELYISYNALGIALMNLKRYSQANTAFSVALAIKPDSAILLNNMGMSLEKMGEPDKARQYFQMALDADSDNDTVRENIERVQALSGK